MKKILHIIDSLGRGGAERLLVDILNNLKNFEHHLIILNDPEKLTEELNTDVRFLNLHQNSHWDLFKNAWIVRKYIRNNKIDLVHSHLYFSNILARLAVPASMPLFNSLHVISSLDNYSKNKLTLYLDRLTYRKRHNIIAVSNEVLNDYDQWVGLKGAATVLFNFIDDAFFQVGRPGAATSAATLKLVAVGNLRYQKNYWYLVEVFKHLPDTVTLDVYGEGSLRQELEEEIERYKLNIKLKGSQKQLYKILPAYDAFIMSSFFEGQPLSLLEGIACGLPAILSDIPVLREVTAEHALYFDLSNPMDLVNKLKAILHGELSIDQNVEPALARISSFAKKEIYLHKLRQLYTSRLPL